MSAKQGEGWSAVKVNTGGVIGLYLVCTSTPRFMVWYIYISALLEHRSKKHTPRKLGSLRLSCPPASTLVCSNPKRAGNGPLLLECLHVFGVRS